MCAHLFSIAMLDLMFHHYFHKDASAGTSVAFVGCLLLGAGCLPSKSRPSEWVVRAHERTVMHLTQQGPSQHWHYTITCYCRSSYILWRYACPGLGLDLSTRFHLCMYRHQHSLVMWFQIVCNAYQMYVHWPVLCKFSDSGPSWWPQMHYRAPHIIGEHVT